MEFLIGLILGAVSVAAISRKRYLSIRNKLREWRQLAITASLKNRGKE
tara:strand:- start:1242 stop:1385 length:144 start_codon:yes stop_codon:yes gene_type:complete